MYNLREFKIYVGETPAAMTEVLHSGLYNDEEEEIIAVSRHVQHYPHVVRVPFVPSPSPPLPLRKGLPFFRSKNTYTGYTMISFAARAVFLCAGGALVQLEVRIEHL